MSIWADSENKIRFEQKQQKGIESRYDNITLVADEKKKHNAFGYQLHQPETEIKTLEPNQ